MFKKYKEYYADDQTELYKSWIVRLIFDLGHRYILDHSKNNPGVFLDLGSGSGYHLNFEEISAKKKYICLDIDKKLLEKITNKLVVKITAGCQKIPLAENSVDVVIASHVLEHLENLNLCLKEIKRVLRNSGQLLVVLPCDPGWLWNLASRLTPSRQRLKKKGFDYDVIMKNEHINSFQFCIEQLEKFFVVKDKKFFPFLIPEPNFNFLCGLELRLKS